MTDQAPEHEGGNHLANRIFFGVIALLGVGLMLAMVWPRGDKSSPEYKEYVQWYNLGYATGNPIGRSVAESNEPPPSPKEVVEKAVTSSKAAGATDAKQAAAYERGFAVGYNDGFRAVAKPGP